MIVRERADAFVMIEQHHHAYISGKLYDQVAINLSLKNGTFHEAVRHAIYHHDIGWEPFDTAPFWDDAKGKPFDFISYPTSIKSVLYRRGIDAVATTNLYAGLLCSEHYVRFLQRDKSTFAQAFVQEEQHRQAAMLKSLDHHDANTFFIHYELLQFFDNLSLYICLHEPGASEEDTHFFFKNGIALPKQYGGDTLHLTWKDTQIVLDQTLFKTPVDVLLTQKLVSKEWIRKVGVAEAWEKAPTETVKLTVTDKSTRFEE